MPTTLPWIAGKRLLEAAKRDYSWSFTFSDGITVVTESGWRLVTQNGVSVSSEDDGQLFGLKEPVDALARVRAATAERKITESRLREPVGDLLLDFGGDVTLEFLTLSCGFESWRAQCGTEEIICMGGGEIAFFSHEKKG